MDTEQMTLEQQHECKEWEVKYKSLKENYDFLQKELEKENSLNVDLHKRVKEQEAQLIKLTKALVEVNAKFKALKAICEVTGETHMSHAQRRVIAWVMLGILNGKQEGAADPIPFNSRCEF